MRAALRGHSALVLAVVLLVSAFAEGTVSPPAGAVTPVQDPLCTAGTPTTARLTVANRFPLQICYDGAALVVKNPLDTVVQLLPLVNGSPVAPPAGWERKADTVDALDLAQGSSDTDPSVLPPDYQVTIPIGPAAQVYRTYIPTAQNDNLFWLKELSAVLPSKLWQDSQAVDTFAQAMQSLDSQRRACLASASNFFAEAGCDAQTFASAKDDVGVLIATLAAANGRLLAELGNASTGIGLIIDLVVTLLSSISTEVSANQGQSAVTFGPRDINFAAAPNFASSCTTAAIMAPVPAYAAAANSYGWRYQAEGNPTCNDGWGMQGTNQLSSTGQIEGPDNIIVQDIGGSWHVVAIGEGEDCAYIPTAGLEALDPTSLPCPGSAPPPTTAPPSDVPNLEVLAADGSTQFDGTRPSWIHFSVDNTDVVENITWSSWTPKSATGTGTWNYDSCSPDCYSAPLVPYSATITLSDQQGGVFMAMTEVTSGPQGSTSNFTYPNEWAMSACTTGPC